MADPGGTSPQFDRIGTGVAGRRRGRDDLGKEALYSTAPSAAPAPQLAFACRRCGVPFGLSVAGLTRLLVPPFAWDPFRSRLWTRCPACGQRAWLTVSVGQGLRSWFARPPRQGG